MPISLTGSLNLSGSLTTTGTITATTLVVQTITSSISSITGSTNFGSLSSNTHVFTGSINTSGSGNFSGSITATDLIISDTYANDPLIKLVTTTSGNVEVQMRTATTTYNAGIGCITSGYDFGLFTNNTTRLFISASGNVGIGTTAPSVVFNVSDPSHGIGIAYRGSSALPSIAGLFTDTGGSGGSGYGDLLVKARTDYGGYYGINFYTAASDNTPVLRMRVQSDGVLNLPYGQIQFPASQNASANANTLDDYEEGTWTPVIGGSGGQSGQTYSGQAGLYTKIGRQVFVTFRVVLSAKGTITGDASIKGLPFTAEGTSFSHGSGATYFEALSTSWNSIYFMVNGGQTYANIDGTKTAGVSAIRATGADISNNTQFNGSFTYFV